MSGIIQDLCQWELGTTPYRWERRTNARRYAGLNCVRENESSKAAEAVDMNERFQMQGGKNWILPK